MSILKALFFLAFFLVVFTFALSNQQLIKLYLDPVADYIEVPLYLLFIVVLLIGILLGSLTTILGKSSASHQLSTTKKRVKALEKEVEGLKLKENLTKPARIEDVKALIKNDGM